MDGEHRADDTPRLVAPILGGEADLVLGARPQMARLSKRFLNRLTRLRDDSLRGIGETGTGLRALRRDLVLRLQLEGRCICGISVLEPAALGARMVEVPIEQAHIEKPRRIAWYHVAQLFCVLRWLMRGRNRNKGG